VCRTRGTRRCDPPRARRRARAAALYGGVVPAQPRPAIVRKLAGYRPARVRAVSLHVGLNVLHLVPGETGGGETYVRRLATALVGARADLRLTLFVGSEAYPTLLEEPWAGDVSVVRLAVRARSRMRRVAAEQTLLPRAARRARIDLLHNTLNTAPAFPGVPQVTTIHDVIYKRFPETAGR